MNILDDDIIQISDMPLIAVLYLHNIKIESINKQNPKRVFFTFESSPEATAIVKKYINGQLTVEPLAYFNAIRGIKNMIYNLPNL